MLTIILVTWFSSSPAALKDPWVGQQLFSQTADGTMRIYHHGPGSLRHRDHALPKGHLFAQDETEAGGVRPLKKGW